jgi:predicted transglutaminase-like cysteine proteinase
MRRALRWLVLRPSLRIASPLAVALLGVLYSDGSAAQKLAALPKSSPGLISWETTKPIPAWNDFCQRYPRECLVDLAEPATVTLTKATWNAILEVNRRVNAAIAPLSDHDHWGALDRWDLPSDGYGDCEDFQLLKRRLLADQGLPRRAMRMTVVINRQGEGHAVLMVRTDPGDLILDNQRSAVLPWDQTGYHLREARKPGDRRVGLLGRACLTHLHGEPIASPAGAAVLIGRLRASRRRGLDPGTRPTIQEPWSPSSAHETGAAERSYKDMFIS